MNADHDRHGFVQKVITTYRHLPDTLGRPRPADRRLAEDLQRRGVPLATIEAAFLLALARRRARPPDAAPLQPIRSLHYFLPVLDELLQHPPPDAYLAALRARLAQQPASPRLTAQVQKTTFLRER